MKFMNKLNCKKGKHEDITFNQFDVGPEHVLERTVSTCKHCKRVLYGSISIADYIRIERRITQRDLVRMPAAHFNMLSTELELELYNLIFGGIGKAAHRCIARDPITLDIMCCWYYNQEDKQAASDHLDSINTSTVYVVEGTIDDKTCDWCKENIGKKFDEYEKSLMENKCTSEHGCRCIVYAQLVKT